MQYVLLDTVIDYGSHEDSGECLRVWKMKLRMTSQVLNEQLASRLDGCFCVELCDFWETPRLSNGDSKQFSKSWVELP